MRRRNGRPGLIGTMARTAVIAGTATALSGNVQQAAAQKQQAAAQEAAQRQAQAAEVAAMQQQVAALQSQLPAPAAPVAPPAPPPPAAGADDLMAQLQQLASMHQAGILSEVHGSEGQTAVLTELAVAPRNSQSWEDNLAVVFAVRRPEAPSRERERQQQGEISYTEWLT